MKQKASDQAKIPPPPAALFPALAATQLKSSQEYVLPNGKIARALMRRGPDDGPLPWWLVTYQARSKNDLAGGRSAARQLLASNPNMAFQVFDMFYREVDVYEIGADGEAYERTIEGKSRRRGRALPKAGWGLADIRPNEGESPYPLR